MRGRRKVSCVAVWLSAMAAACGADEPSAVDELRQSIAQLDETIWKKESLAQEYEATFVKLWDDLRADYDKYRPLVDFPLESITLGKPAETVEKDWGIRVTSWEAGGSALDRDAWRAFVSGLKTQGYRFVQSEWHHSRFEWDPPRPARSTVSFKIHALRARTRYILEGDLEVVWKEYRDDGALQQADTLAVEKLQIRKRTGRPAFEKQMRIDPRLGDPPKGITGVLVYDLNHDGLPEIILPGNNSVLWNKGGFRFHVERLIPGPKMGAHTALIADFTGDGHVDLLITRPRAGVFLCPGNAEGRFTKGPILVDAVPPAQLINPMAITAGDIDGDGDLDVWIGQWIDSYAGAGGSLPATYYDANDSDPSFLLVNDGKGGFVDGTKEAGLAPKRHRRTLSCSLVDLDDDGDADLLVVSDYAGVDVHLNDGRGRFTEAVGMIPNRHNFGMAHAFGDYDLDGTLDFYVIGMSSTTARRLDAMGLTRSDRKEIAAMRGKMGYGNRMYLRRKGGYEQAPFNDQVARSGWSWGVTALDFDNDGDRDLYIANGGWSGKSAKDYCTRFWCHDLYLGTAEPSPAVDGYFKELRFFPQFSWNPYEKNCLFMNEAGKGFVEVGFLFDVALDIDARQLVSADLDADGRMDLVVGQLVLSKIPMQSFLHLLRNRWSGGGNWIGVHLDDRTAGVSPLGAEVRVRTPGGIQLDRVVAGDGYMGQHPATKHFGLGAIKHVDEIVVRWPDGSTTRVAKPAVNQYHRIAPPARR